jgi:pimeloyl-ACP methyl ester carboxylesterase
MSCSRGELAADNFSITFRSSLGAIVTETPFFFARGAASLFGMLHAPQGAARKTAFVMSHPFAEEKLWSHRVFVSCARALAARGHAVLRFDYMGAGDSSGMTPDTSLATHLADLSAALDTLRARHPAAERVGLIGLRLGATIAALLAEEAAAQNRHEYLRDAPLLLWDPILDGESYFQEVLRSNLSTQLAVFGKVQENREILQEKIRQGGSVNVDGYEIGKPLFESCAVHELLSQAAKRHTGPVLVLQIAAGDQAKGRDDLRGLARAYTNGSFVRTNEQPFWREIKPFYGRAENLQQTSLSWMEQQNV